MLPTFRERANAESRAEGTFLLATRESVSDTFAVSDGKIAFRPTFRRKLNWQAEGK